MADWIWGRWGIGASGGCFGVSQYAYAPLGHVSKGFILAVDHPRIWGWQPLLKTSTVQTDYCVPIWGVVAVMTVFSIGMWRYDAIARRRERAVGLNLCPKCNYNRAGLASGAKCPECGSPFA